MTPERARNPCRLPAVVLAAESDSECPGSPVRMHAANGVQPGASGRVVGSAAADHMQRKRVDVGDVRGGAGAAANGRGTA